jgi:hypothetical protein
VWVELTVKVVAAAALGRNLARAVVLRSPAAYRRSRRAKGRCSGRRSSRGGERR